MFSILIGSFGEVWRVIHKISRDVRAMKIVKKTNANNVDHIELDNEIAVLKKLVIRNFEYLGSSKYPQTI